MLAAAGAGQAPAIVLVGVDTPWLPSLQPLGTQGGAGVEYQDAAPAIAPLSDHPAADGGDEGTGHAADDDRPGRAGRAADSNTGAGRLESADARVTITLSQGEPGHYLNEIAFRAAAAQGGPDDDIVPIDVAVAEGVSLPASADPASIEVSVERVGSGPERVSKGGVTLSVQVWMVLINNKPYYVGVC